MMLLKKPPNSSPAAPVHHIDPVCGMTVDPADAAGSHRYNGKTYYFCNPSCLERFKADPQKYLEPDKAAIVVAGPDNIEYTCPMDPEVRQMGPGSCPKCGMALEPVNVTLPVTRTEWTCPMHPEVVRSEPGSCPICGMALEPRTVTAEEQNPELRTMTRRFWTCVALTSPILALMVSEMLPGKPVQTWLGGNVLLGVEFLLATPVVLWGGWPFFVRGWQSVVNRHLNMFTLIALGTGAAYLYSVAA